MWMESPCLIIDNEAITIAGLTVPVEMTVYIDVAIVKTINKILNLFSSHTS